MDKISDDCDIKSLPHMKLCFKYEARSRKGIVEVIDSLEDGEYTWLPEWYINKKTNKND